MVLQERIGWREVDRGQWAMVPAPPRGRCSPYADPHPVTICIAGRLGRPDPLVVQIESAAPNLAEAKELVGAHVLAGRRSTGFGAGSRRRECIPLNERNHVGIVRSDVPVTSIWPVWSLDLPDDRWRRAHSSRARRNFRRRPRRRRSDRERGRGLEAGWERCCYRRVRTIPPP